MIEGEKEAQRQGEDRVTLRITLMCKRFENLGCTLAEGGTPSLHHQCKATTETWGCRTPLRSMRHSSCLHPSVPPAAATAVRHASPPRPRKHAAAPCKAPGGGGGVAGQRKLMVEKLWQELFSDPSQWWDSRLGKGNARYPDFKHKSRAAALWLNIKLN